MPTPTARMWRTLAWLALILLWAFVAVAQQEPAGVLPTPVEHYGPPHPARPDGRPLYQQGRFIVRLAPTSLRPQAIGSEAALPTYAPSPALQQAAAQLGGALQPMFPSAATPGQPGAAGGAGFRDEFWVFRTTSTLPAQQLCAALASQPGVLYAEPIPVFYPLGPSSLPASTLVPDDQYLSFQWGLPMVQAFEAFAVAQGDSTVVIAISDDAVQWDHEDLMSILHTTPGEVPGNGIDDNGDGYIDNVHGWDFIGASDTLWSPDGDARPASSATGHGTIVAGYALAQTDNAIGNAGLSFNCRLMPLKTGPDNASLVQAGYESILYAAENGADIINCSWGSFVFSQAAQDFVHYITDSLGVLIVAPTSNSNNTDLIYPAAYDGVLSVGGLVQDSSKLFRSGYGPWIDIFAPSGGGTTAYNNTYVAFSNGSYTSWACPHVAGIAGLVLSHRPGLSPRQLAALLCATAVSVDSLNPGYEGLLGAGLVNAYRALTLNPPGIILQTQPELTQDLPLAATSPLPLSLQVLNAPATNAYLRLSASSPYLQPVLDSLHLGTLPADTTLQLLANLHMDGCAPGGQPIYLYADVLYDGGQQRHTFTLTPARGFANLPSGRLTTTLSQNGRIGSTGFAPSEGQGLLYRNRTALAEGGFVIGYLGTVYDATRGELGPPDADWCASAGPTTSESLHGSEYVSATFTDAGHNTPLGLNVSLQLERRAEPAPQGVIYATATVRQATGQPLDSLYIGWLLDWDLGTNATNDSLRFDSTRRLAYALGSDNSTTRLAVGVLQLGSGPLASQATSNPSFTYTNAAKWQALTSPSTDSISGTDVVQTLALGPIELPANDSLQLRFAFIGADDEAALLALADQVLQQEACFATAPDILIPADTACGRVILQPSLTPATFWFWDDLTADSTYTHTTSGRYGLTWRNALGCVFFEEVDVTVLPEPALSFTLSQDTLLTGEPVQFTATAPEAILASWAFGDGTAYDIFTGSHRYSTAGIYTVTVQVTAPNGCPATLQDTLYVFDDRPLTAQDLILYPNPGPEAQLRTSRPFSGQVQLSVVNTQGGVVHTTQLPAGAFYSGYSLPSGMLPGVYSVRVQHLGQALTKKWLVQR